MGYMNSLPEIIKIANVLNFDNWYLSARQPSLGFASPNATPPIRAAHNIIQTSYFQPFNNDNNMSKKCHNNVKYRNSPTPG